MQVNAMREAEQQQAANAQIVKASMQTSINDLTSSGNEATKEIESLRLKIGMMEAEVRKDHQLYSQHSLTPISPY